MKKHCRKSRQRKFWKRVCAICNLHLYYKFALMLLENAPIFSQSKACSLFMYIITIETLVYGV